VNQVSPRTPPNRPAVSGKVLVVEDDGEILDLLREELKTAGHEVVTAASVSEAQEVFDRQLPDLVILDLGLPDGDGLAVAEHIRRGGNTPILVLTARAGLDQRVAGLYAGADDYVVKPFEVDELMARVHAQLRRQRGPTPAALRLGQATLYANTRECEVGGTRIELTAREFELLEVLLRHPGRVFSRRELENRFYPEGTPGESNVVEAHISNVRRKLRAAGADRLIRTIRGVGYTARELASG